jgi:pteridine reductase
MNAPEFQRVALVTGGAVRVGRAISLGLAEAGYDVVVHHRSSAAEAEELAERIRELGCRAALAAGDLREPAVARSVVDVARRTFGRLDLLVNSAASFRAGPLLEWGAEAWDDVMALNVRAPHLLVRAAADLLDSVGGSVVNIVDLSAFQPWTLHPVHAVSKAALAHLTRVQARALAPGVRVNAIAPGAVLPPDDYDEEATEALRQIAPLGKLGSPEDVVRAVLFLANAGYVTGQILAVDGGRLLGRAGPSVPE